MYKEWFFDSGNVQKQSNKILLAEELMGTNIDIAVLTETERKGRKRSSDYLPF